MVAGSTAPDKDATPFDRQTQNAIRLHEVPNGSYQDPRYNQPILFVAVQLASSHSLERIKFAGKSVL